MTIIKIAKSSQKSSTTFSLLPPALFSLSFLISMTVTRISKIPHRNFNIFSLLHHIPIFPLSFLISMINIGNSKNPEKNFIITFSPQRVFRERFYFFPLFLSLSSFRVFASSFLIPEITTSFRELETTINSITSRNARYYYGAILGQPAHRQTKTIRARPIIVRTGLSLSLSPFLPLSTWTWTFKFSRRSDIVTSLRATGVMRCEITLHSFESELPSWLEWSLDEPSQRLDKCTVNNHLYRMNTEGGERRGCDDRVLSNELDFQGARKR